MAGVRVAWLDPHIAYRHAVGDNDMAQLGRAQGAAGLGPLDSERRAGEGPPDQTDVARLEVWVQSGG
jgi:hypothetical protein